MAKDGAQSQAGGLSRQVLKDVIERRRQNDLVRKQEFDRLRKIRRCDIPATINPAGRPPLVQSSSPANPDERAQTLKKIDAIEAQMVRQWWEDKQSGLATIQLASTGLPDPSDTSDPFSPTLMGYCGSEPVFQAMPGLPGRQSSALSGEPCPGLTESGVRLADPDLEEAAIRFANGDEAGAEAILLTALQAHSPSPERTAVWAQALFDLYRFTDQQERFKSVAAVCASRFGIDAPEWFSTPELLGRKTLVPSATAEQGSLSKWVCPASLTPDALAQLPDVLASALTPAVLDWRATSRFEPAALGQLATLFAHWCDKPVKLHFIGQEVLTNSLTSITPCADKSVSSLNWELRMAALRVMRLRDEFELVALEYCVTYEAPPPVWQAALCTCELDLVSARHAYCAAPLAQTAAAQVDGTGVLSVDPSMAGAAVVELAGEVVGDAADALARLEAEREDSNPLLISCARLIRVDFSAAGRLLHWVAAQQASGYTVEFIDVNRMIAAFFNVIGITEHARVITRSN